MGILSVCPNPSVDTFVWVDHIHAGRVTRAEREQHFPGGKGYM
jgi:tagatose 6-phosphate kinase